MIYHRIREPELFLVVCGSFWPGAPEQNDYYEHLVRTGEATCNGVRPSTRKKCACKVTAPASGEETP